MLAEDRWQARIRISSLAGTFIWERTGAFLRSPRVMGTTLHGLRMPESRLIWADESSHAEAFFFAAESGCLGRICLQSCGRRVMDEGAAARRWGPEKRRHLWLMGAEDVQ